MEFCLQLDCAATVWSFVYLFRYLFKSIAAFHPRTYTNSHTFAHARTHMCVFFMFNDNLVCLVSRRVKKYRSKREWSAFRLWRSRLHQDGFVVPRSRRHHRRAYVVYGRTILPQTSFLSLQNILEGSSAADAGSHARMRFVVFQTIEFGDLRIYQRLFLKRSSKPPSLVS